MYLSKLRARNLQGADLDLDLTRANAVVGDNFKGKSRILNAARLLLVGHLPELGKENRATFGLASGPFLEVSGVLTDGSRSLSISRHWALRGDSVTATREVPDELAACPVLTVMLNAEEYFGLSDRDRVAYVFRNVPGSAVDIPALDAQLRREVVGFQPEWPPHRADRPVTPQDFIEHNLARAADEAKRAKDWAKRMEETVRGLTGLRAQDPVATANRAELLDERARCERELTELRERKGLRIGAFTAMRDAAERRKAIEREIQHGQKDAQEIAAARQKVALFEAELARDPGTPAMEDLQAQSDAVSALAIRLAAARQERDAAADAENDLSQEIHELDGQTSCPFCGAGGDTWKGTKAAELSEKHHAAEQRLAAARLAVGTAEAEEGKARAALRTQQERFAAARRLREGLAAANAALSFLAPRVARVQALQESLASLPPPDAALAAEVEEIQGRINVKTQEAGSLDRVIAEQDARQAEVARLAEAEAERDKAQAEQVRWTAAGERLRCVQAELVEAAFRPLLAAANGYFPGVLRAPLDYHAGEVGMWVAGAWVGHGTFSGTEKALTYAAIQCALAARSPVRVMMLDELGRLTRRNAEEVARLALIALQSGKIDQFFGVDPERPEIYRAAAAGQTPDGESFNVVTVY